VEFCKATELRIAVTLSYSIEEGIDGRAFLISLRGYQRPRFRFGPPKFP
jgi:hypothetical protein